MKTPIEEADQAEVPTCAPEERYEGEWIFVLHGSHGPPDWLFRNGWVDFADDSESPFGRVGFDFSGGELRVQFMPTELRRLRQPALDLRGPPERLLPVGSRFSVRHLHGEPILAAHIDGETLHLRGQMAFTVEPEDGSSFDIDLRLTFQGDRTDG